MDGPLKSIKSLCPGSDRGAGRIQNVAFIVTEKMEEFESAKAAMGKKFS